MTTKLEQAARQAIHKINQATALDEESDELLMEALTALREALAEQEPVAWAMTSESGEVLDCISNQYKVTQPCTVDYDEPLYAAPVRTKDLTDDELWEIWFKDITLDFDERCRAVIAKFKEKNNVK